MCLCVFNQGNTECMLKFNCSTGTKMKSSTVFYLSQSERAGAGTHNQIPAVLMQNKPDHIHLSYLTNHNAKSVKVVMSLHAFL